VNETQLAMCLKKQDASFVDQSLKLGASLGVNATPQVFVDGERLPSGAQPIEKLWPAIDRALKAQGIQPPASKVLKVEHP
jgi:protein-disulfide isomerase